MELFERIKTLAKIKSGSDRSFAETLGFKQSTFAGYLKRERQDNLWPLLPLILKRYPDVCRNWLYFDEGPMLAGGMPEEDGMPALKLTPGQKRESGRSMEELDEDLLRRIIVLLEQHLEVVKGELAPEAKAEAIIQLYLSIREKEAEPLETMKLIMGALARVTPA